MSSPTYTRFSPAREFLGDHVENVAEFCPSLFSRGHQRVAPGDGGNLCNPGAIILAIEDDLVRVEPCPPVHGESIPWSAIPPRRSLCLPNPAHPDQLVTKVK